MMENTVGTKKTIKSILKVSISNIIKLLSGVLVGFLLPKIIGVTDYGYFKTFTLYATYIGLFHFGFADGIYLKFGGKDFNELEKKSFRMYGFFLAVLEVIVTIIVTGISLFTLQGELKFIFVCIAAYMLTANIINYYQIISQITNRFTELSIRNIIQSVMTIISLAILWVIHKCSGDLLSYRVYTIIYVSISFFLMAWYLFTYRSITFGKKKKISENRKELFSFFAIGFPLLIANLCSSLILAIDRQFVNILFDTDTYAIYAFAYNMLALITTALAAISTVLYPALKRVNKETLKRNYDYLMKIVLVLVFALLLSYFPLCAFVIWFLPQYSESLPIFRIILPGLAVSSTITLIMHNYYKTEGKELMFFFKSIFILVLSALANYIAYSIFKTTTSISIASIGVMVIWFFLIEEYFIRTYKVRWIKNSLYILFMSIVFYLITIWDNWLATLFIYLLSFILITCLFYSKEIINIVRHNKKDISNEQFEDAIQKEGAARILVTGVAGQLGYDIIKELSSRNMVAIGTDIRLEEELISKASWEKYYQCDITDKNQVAQLISTVKPNAIIHCAAWTSVDGAEDENNKQLVKKINVEGTDNLVKAAKTVGAKFIYISTDYVFNGEGSRPWEPDDKNYAPQNYYGQTKLDGELAVSSQLNKYFIVRIAWVFGLNGNNFIKTMLKLSDKGYKELRVVDDQIGTPTYTYDLARLLVDMVLTDKYGYYHATNEGGYISWADFAEEIFKQAKKDVKVNRVTTEEYGVSIAKRPFNSRLDKSKLIENGFKPLPNWKDALSRYLEDIKEK